MGIIFHPYSLVETPSSVSSAQVEAGLEHVRATLGSEEQSGLTDSLIMETLWDCYCDVDKTIEWLIGTPICSPTRQKSSRFSKRYRRGRMLPAREKVSCKFLVLVPLGWSVSYYSTPSPSPFHTLWPLHKAVWQWLQEGASLLALVDFPLQFHGHYRG
jgi:HBS1 N-terminus